MIDDLKRRRTHCSVNQHGVFFSELNAVFMSCESCSTELHNPSEGSKRVRSSLTTTGIKCLVAVQETSKAVQELEQQVAEEQPVGLLAQLNTLEKALKSLDSKAVSRQVRPQLGKLNCYWCIKGCLSVLVFRLGHIYKCLREPRTLHSCWWVDPS